MKNTKLIAACAGFICANTVFAHDITGLSGTHWHTSDAVGYCVLAALAGVSAWAVWRDRGGK
jgi:hypothetical protein